MPRDGHHTLAHERLADNQVAAFRRDGFLIVEQGFISGTEVEALRERFARVFEGEYETGIKPDEVNWVPGRDPEDVTRQICNAWRADDVIAAQVLSERTGRLAAQLMGYRGARLLQDNCPGRRPARSRSACTRTARTPTTWSHPRWSPAGSRSMTPARTPARSSTRAARIAGRGCRRADPSSMRQTIGSLPSVTRFPMGKSSSWSRSSCARRLRVPPLAHLPRIRTEPGYGRAPRTRLASRVRRDRLSPDERRSDLFALPSARRSRSTSRSSRSSRTRAGDGPRGSMSSASKRIELRAFTARLWPTPRRSGGT